MLDTSLWRAGWFDWEIMLKVPSEEDWLEILNVLTKNMRVWGKAEMLKEISNLSPGYVPADLATLCKEATI